MAGKTVTTTGTISASYTNTTFAALYLDAANITVTNTGTLDGGSYGVSIRRNSVSFTNAQTGYIFGTRNQGGFGANGVYLIATASADTIVNYGRIIGSANLSDSGIFIVSGSNVSGVPLSTTVINKSTGTIKGGSAIYDKLGVATVVNYGLLQSNNVAYGAVDLDFGGVVINKAGGTIDAHGGKYGIKFAYAGRSGVATVTNAGTIIGGTSIAAVAFANVANNRFIDLPTGTITGGNGTLVDGGSAATFELGSAGSTGTLNSFGSKYVNFSNITVDAGASWQANTTDNLGAGISIANAGTLRLTTGETIAAAITNTGTMQTDGTVTTTGLFTNSGQILLNTGTLTLGSISGSGTITFGATTGDILSLNSADAGGDIIANMQPGQTIEITGQTVTSSNLHSGNTLGLTLSGGGTIALHLAPGQSFAGEYFHQTTVGTNSFITESSQPCYLAGTRIRTDRGEIPVEQLAIGDRVLTWDGTFKPIKWIGRRAYSSAFAAGNRDVIPILFKQGSLGANLPERDLIVSPLHAMFLNGVLVPAEHLVNGKSVLRCPEIDPIRYFHIELEKHDVIFAEGAPAETFVDCDSRAMFHNAPEFATLYPGDDAPGWQFCFPRIESGPELETIRRDIDARAGLSDAPGPLQGNLDGLDGNRITGWAFDPAHPETPVILEILDGDGLLARVTANRFRADLEAAGIGDGRHGFELMLPSPLSAQTRHELRARRLTDGQELDGSPQIIEASDQRTRLAEARHAIDQAIAAGAAGETLQTLLKSIDQVRRLRLSQPVAARRRRALFVATRLPRVGQDAVLSEIEALHSDGWQIEAVAIAERVGADDAVAALKAFGVTCHRAPHVASVEEVLRRERDSFDLVWLGEGTDAYAALAHRWQKRARLVFGGAIPAITRAA
jgi:O-antigen biosynthesis protein